MLREAECEKSGPERRSAWLKQVSNGNRSEHRKEKTETGTDNCEKDCTECNYNGQLIRLKNLGQKCIILTSNKHQNQHQKDHANIIHTTIT